MFKEFSGKGKNKGQLEGKMGFKANVLEEASGFRGRELIGAACWFGGSTRVSFKEELECGTGPESENREMNKTDYNQKT